MLPPGKVHRFSLPGGGGVHSGVNPLIGSEVNSLIGVYLGLPERPLSPVSHADCRLLASITAPAENGPQRTQIHQSPATAWINVKAAAVASLPPDNGRRGSRSARQ